MEKNKIKIYQDKITYAINIAVAQGFLVDEDNSNYISYNYNNTLIMIPLKEEILKTEMLKKKKNGKIYIPKNITKILDLMLNEKIFSKDEIKVKNTYFREFLEMCKSTKNIQKIRNYLLIISNLKIRFTDPKGMWHETKILDYLNIEKTFFQYKFSSVFVDNVSHFLHLNVEAFKNNKSPLYYDIYKVIEYNKIINNRNEKRKSQITVKQLLKNVQLPMYEDLKDRKDLHPKRLIINPVIETLEQIQNDEICFREWNYDDEKQKENFYIDNNKLFIYETKEKMKKPPKTYMEWSNKKINFVFFT